MKKIFVIFALIFFIISNFSFAESDRAIKVIENLSHSSGKLGTYKSLIIGINDYNDPKIPDLETAVNDAKEMADVLKNRYGFSVDLLLNQKATRKAIYSALRKLANNSKSSDSILIYYAGHGDLDRTYDDGWWIPVDAQGGDPVTYLDNGQVQKAMRAMKSRHVLLISDSCYSGTLFGQARAMPQVIDDRYYLNMYNEKSRWGMTSGNKTPVSDAGTGKHSVFAYQLIKALKKNEKPYVSTQEIYTKIAPIIANNSEQQPLCRPVRSTGDQGGEFVFVASSGVPQRPTYSNDFSALEEERMQLEKERKELEQMKALMDERKRIEAERKRLEEEKAKLAMSKRPKKPTAREIKRDGRFIAYDNGTVLDTKTRLMWAAKDNGGDIDWHGAKRYCETYTGGGYTDWRMPTKDELWALYNSGSGYPTECAKETSIKITDLIKVTCYMFWSSNNRGEQAVFVNLPSGRWWDQKSKIYRSRALPVRSGN